jgi:hypothetical protein
MLEKTSIEFFEKPGAFEGYLCIADINGDERVIIDSLNKLLSLKRENLYKDNSLPKDCSTCFKVFGIEKSEKSTLLFFKACCGIRRILTLEEIKGFLFHEFENVT